VNETAGHDDQIAHTYHKTIHLSRSATKPNGKTVVLTSEAAVPVQSEFLQREDTTTRGARRQAIPPGQAIKKGQHVNIPVSGSSSIRLTSRPREKGVASFRNDRTVAIAANRVLLGTAVGLLSPLPKSTHTLINTVANIDIDTNLSIPDQQVDPLLAVTLSDLL
ncbi:unnamed protein product, partial [Oppiella nova]